MQVSHVNEHITHAVIGGKQAIDFGISNSAEFFNILSSTLYKDQILAVVREVLCNAWDAHIEAGCTDRPVQITLEDEKFTIRDFGKGIHHDDMGLIYGTYGNSTKKNDGMQTGGFGLGCKAPFAYTDHFEVISHHEGIKTIYNLSKSSAQAMGKPGIIPIASFPTNESGLLVSIMINKRDYSRFHQLIKRIASNGDMNMSLNGELLDTLGFDTSKGNYLICRNKTFLDLNTQIMVRYGNVIYPVDIVKEISANYDEIVKHLAVLNSNAHNRLHIVFQAPSHSISVTPSRESLSMQEHTINTLNKLFTDFLQPLKTEFPLLCTQYAQEIVQKAVIEERVDELLKRKLSFPKNDSFSITDTITDLEVMAKTYIHLHYPKGVEYRKKDISYRLYLMSQQKLLDKGLVQTFTKSLTKVTEDAYSKWHEQRDESSWLQRRVIAPLLVSLEKAGVDAKKLYVCDPEDAHALNRYTESNPALVPATCACPTHIFNALPYLRNIIVLATKRANLVSDAYDHEDFEGLGDYQGFLVYVVGRKVGEIEAARNFFAKTGMRLIDLTIKEADSSSLKSNVVRKPIKKGLVCLSSVGTSTGLNIEWRFQDDAARIDNPEFVIHIPNTKSIPYYHLEGWTTNLSREIVRLFGDKGGIVATRSSMDTWIAKGAKSFKAYLIEKVTGHIRDNPRIKEYWAHHPSRIGENMSVAISDLVLLIHEIPSLTKKFGLINNLTDEDRVYIRLWNRLMDMHVLSVNDTTKAWLDSIPLSASSKKFITKLENNPLLEILDMHSVRRLIKENPTPTQIDKIASILISAITN